MKIAVKVSLVVLALLVTTDCAVSTKSRMLLVEDNAVEEVKDKWLELPADYLKSAISTTTTSSLEGLIKLTHYAEFLGQNARNYTVLYDPEMCAAYWVAYPLCKEHMGQLARPKNFPKDPDVNTALQTNIKDKAYGVKHPTSNYPNNYYARGHQLPNADRNGVTVMQEQAFYATNITPQIQSGFNALIWEKLEEGVRESVTEGDTVYVVTGAAFKKVGGSEKVETIVNTIDQKELPVPNYYWKVLLKVKRSAGTVIGASTIGFWLPHDDLKGHTYTEYNCSVNQIEAWTGFDFFDAVPDAFEETAENNSDWNSFLSF